VAPADNGASIDVFVSNVAGAATSDPAVLTVVTSATPVNVLTYHNAVARTGLNPDETPLNASNFNHAGFGKVGFLAVTGKVDAKPLYVSALSVRGATHNVVFVVTESALAYAFDADSLGLLWKASALAAGERRSDSQGCDQIAPSIGMTATPVIDRSGGPNGTMYCVAMSKDGAGNYLQRLHVLDLSSG